MAAEYQLLTDDPNGEPIAILHVTTGLVIPPDPANRDFQTFRAWVDAGNTPDPAVWATPPSTA